MGRRFYLIISRLMAAVFFGGLSNIGPIAFSPIGRAALHFVQTA